MRNPLRKLLSFVPGQPKGGAVSYKQVLKAVRKYPYEQKKEVLSRALAGLSERKVIETLQDFSVVKRLGYDKADVLLHADTKAAYLRHRAVIKEPWTVAWIEHCVARGGVFYDIGANVGVYSLLAAKLGGDGLLTYAFEPAFATYADLCRNTVLNDITDRVIPIPVALSDSDALLDFGFNSTEAGSALHGVETVGKAGGTPRHVMHVLGRTLDDLCASTGMQPPTHVKIDVDGGERAVLAGAEKTLAQPGVQTVMMEVPTEADLEAYVLSYFEKLGFTLAREFHKTPAHGGEEMCWYALYARKPETLPMDVFDGLKASKERL